MTRPLAYLFLLGILVPQLAWSQDKKLAITNPTEADADFAYQGEFAAYGWGLQVVAGGKGKFDGVIFYGGLPGAGWNQSERIKLQGQLENDVLLLTSAQYSATVHPSHAVVADASGRVVARLSKQMRRSPTLGLRPPAGAVVLFDGANADKFQNGKLSDDGMLRMGTMTKEKVGDFRLHLEWAIQQWRVHSTAVRGADSR
jgi:hypothetical protein